MPSKLTNLVFLAAILVSAYAAPTPAKRDLSTNSCDGQDVEGRKKLFMDNGADVTDIAIAIQENACYFNSANPTYAYGDDKSDDSANFGPFKNNWYAIRTWCSDLQVFAGKNMQDYNTGALLNDDNNLGAAIQCQHQQMTGANGSDRTNGWWAVQRDGSTPGSCGVDPEGYNYHNGINQIVDYLNTKTATGTHLDDNTIVDPVEPPC